MREDSKQPANNAEKANEIIAQSIKRFRTSQRQAMVEIRKALQRAMKLL